MTEDEAITHCRIRKRLLELIHEYAKTNDDSKKAAICNEYAELYSKLREYKKGESIDKMDLSEYYNTIANCKSRMKALAEEQTHTDIGERQEAISKEYVALKFKLLSLGINFSITKEKNL